MAEYLKENCCGTVCYSTAPSGEGKESRPTSTMATDTAAGPERQPMPAAVIPVKRKKSKTEWIFSGSDKRKQDLQNQWKKPEKITLSLSLGEVLLIWLLQCRDIVAPDGSEAKQLESLYWDAGIDQWIRRRPETFSLCRQLLSSVRERYPCKDELLVHHKGWSDMAQGVWYVRELAVPEIIFSDNEKFANNPESVQCTENMRQKFVWNVPAS